MSMKMARSYDRESRGKNLRPLVHVLCKTFHARNLKLLSKNLHSMRDIFWLLIKSLALYRF